ncbi:unnamed protein product, partial [Vitis vinifera]|uniref:Uncharacterized protein n=1 Tax=Vitis vinifera TaxID=29760 RepID=D7TVJ0_VITVI
MAHKYTNAKTLFAQAWGIKTLVWSGRLCLVAPLPFFSITLTASIPLVLEVENGPLLICMSLYGYITSSL